MSGLCEVIVFPVVNSSAVVSSLAMGHLAFLGFDLLFLYFTNFTGWNITSTIKTTHPTNIKKSVIMPKEIIKVITTLIHTNVAKTYSSPYISMHSICLDVNRFL